MSKIFLGFRLGGQAMTKIFRIAFDWLRSDNRKSKIENLKWGWGFAIILTFSLCGAVVVEAQQTGKIFRIGFLDSSNASGMAGLLGAFQQELNKLGWIEGKNITIEHRFAEGKPERLPELAADLVRLKVDLIMITGDPAGLAAKKATKYHPHRDDELCGPRGSRFGCQSGAAGRQCHRVLEFSDRAKYQKARGTQGRGPQAHPSWTFVAVGRQRSNRPPTERTPSRCSAFETGSGWSCSKKPFRNLPVSRLSTNRALLRPR